MNSSQFEAQVLAQSSDVRIPYIDPEVTRFIKEVILKDYALTKDNDNTFQSAEHFLWKKRYQEGAQLVLDKLEYYQKLRSEGEELNQFTLGKSILDYHRI